MAGWIVQAIGWFEDDAHRLERDLQDVSDFAPDMVFVPPSVEAASGGWTGQLPLWPFDRPAPVGLDAMFPRGGLGLEVRYTPAYPMVPPDFWPRDPEPEIVERSQSVWHVLPSGALCLLQSVGQWHPEASITQLLLKAAGWHLEYRLMKLGQLEKMTEHGIVSDSEHDHLLAEGGD